nr:TRAP transporter small permease subunit [Bradyrhizobium sp. 159]
MADLHRRLRDDPAAARFRGDHADGASFGAPRQKLAKVISTGLVVVFGAALIVTCVLWMDPIGLARAGFDGRKLAAETFNFLYTEHTQTLNWPTWVLYLTLPIFAVSMTIHGLANLLEDLELVPRTSPKGFQLSELDGVN